MKKHRRQVAASIEITGLDVKLGHRIIEIGAVARIESYGESGKYKLIFDGKAEKITPIPLKNAPRGSMQGPRYTTRDKLLKAKTVLDAF